MARGRTRLGGGSELEQTTLARRVTCRGIGLHGGDEVEVALCPAEADTGIVFVLVAEPPVGRDSSDSTTARAPFARRDDVEIPARVASVESTSRATTLVGESGATLSTVEHLLAALYAFGIDNLRIEVKGNEIPVLDGSARGFVAALQEAGRASLGTPREIFEVVQPLAFSDGDRSIRIEPSDVLSIHYTIDFDHPRIGRQVLEVDLLDARTFESELAGARTFGFESEVAALRTAGLALGGSLENAIVLDDSRVLNPTGLRWPDEFVRHKVVDLLGDLALLGFGLRGRLVVERGGHSLHHRLVRGLVESTGVLRRVDQFAA